ncbi:GNAT family N-acetyltransferase [Pseudoalteromonas sp.]|uniref:GNAT family N-acetyltransferase n=1 Tax=Pseudoalteromonas sp. TaxID=53249 RepID=UPI0035673552
MFTQIKLPRVRLRLITHKHAASLFCILNHPQVAQFNDYQLPLSNTDIKQLIQDDISGYYHGDLLRVAIEHNNTGQLLGCCGLYSIDKDKQMAYLGFELHPHYWQQGIMSEALVAFINTMQRSLGLTKLIAEVHKHNTPSHKLLTKLGFSKQGKESAAHQVKSSCELWHKQFT